MTGSTGGRAAPDRHPCNEPTLDQLLAEPIVQQLMRRDRIDEAAIRHLLQETAAAQLANALTGVVVRTAGPRTVRHSKSSPWDRRPATPLTRVGSP